MRLCGSLRDRCLDQLPQQLLTNFGMSRRLRVELARTAPRVHLFGTPDQADGERSSMYLCRALIARCRVFVDIGAHIGSFVFFVRETDKVTPIYYFEANPALFQQLGVNCRRNALPGMFAFPLAIGDKPGEVTFYLDHTDNSSSSLTPRFAARHEVETITVQAVRFDDFSRHEALSEVCVKVDIEGAEREFLEGVGEESDRIAYLVIEILGPAIDAGFVNAARKRLSMEAYYIADFRLEHSRHGEYRYRSPHYNWLFCRHSPGELRRLLVNTRFSVVTAG